MISTGSENPIYAPPRVSDVSPTLRFKMLFLNVAYLGRFQFQMISTGTENPICASPHLSDVSQALPFKQFVWSTAALSRPFKQEHRVHPFSAQSSRAVWKSRWPPWAFRPNEPYGFCERNSNTEPCFGIGHSLSLILMSTDIQ